MSWSRLLPLAALVVLSCGRPSSSPRPAPAADDAGPTTAAPADAAPAPVPAAADAAPAPPPVADAGPLGAAGDRCATDADCGWDDPCKATRCGAAREPVACEKSFPRPGTCTCVARQCTLRPNEPARGASAPGCTVDATCAIDVGTATCHLGGKTLIGPIEKEGPVCTCEAASTRCQWSFAGPVACKSWRDCSWARVPRLRPVSSKLVPRPVARPVRPCKDGEVDSVCKPDGTCAIVAWSC